MSLVGMSLELWIACICSPRGQRPRLLVIALTRAEPGSLVKALFRDRGHGLSLRLMGLATRAENSADHICNPQNDNQPVRKGKDGQERFVSARSRLPPGVARKRGRAPVPVSMARGG